MNEDKEHVLSTINCWEQQPHPVGKKCLAGNIEVMLVFEKQTNFNKR